MEETLELLVVKEAHSCSAQQRTQGTTSVITMTGFGDVKIIFVYRGKKKITWLSVGPQCGCFTYKLFRILKEGEKYVIQNLIKKLGCARSCKVL